MIRQAHTKLKNYICNNAGYALIESETALDNFTIIKHCRVFLESNFTGFKTIIKQCKDWEYKIQYGKLTAIDKSNLVYFVESILMDNMESLSPKGFYFGNPLNDTSKLGWFRK